MGKRHESIERMKAITAKYLTDEKYVIENGTLAHAGIVPRVKNRLKTENIPFETIHDSITVTPEHFAILQRITDEVMREMIQPACTAMDVASKTLLERRGVCAHISGVSGPA